MMSVERTTETFVNKCSRCSNRWRVMLEVDIIDWGSGLSSIVSTRNIECPKCRKFTPIRKVTDKNE